VTSTLLIPGSCSFFHCLDLQVKEGVTDSSVTPTTRLDLYRRYSQGGERLVLQFIHLLVGSPGLLRDNFYRLRI